MSGSRTFHLIERLKITVNPAIFFTILYWLLVYFLLIKRKFLVKELNLFSLAILIGINLAIILCSGFLTPVFEMVLKVSQKIGSLIYGLIAAVVYLFILTPIALYKKSTGHKLMEVEIEKDKTSYYEDWESSRDIFKQY